MKLQLFIMASFKHSKKHLKKPPKMKTATSETGPVSSARVNQEPGKYLRLPNGSKCQRVKVAFAIDVSASMGQDRFLNGVLRNVEEWYNHYPGTPTVTYGPSDSRPISYSEFVNYKLQEIINPNLQVVSSIKELMPQMVPFGTTSAFKLRFLPEANIYVLMGDGALDDPKSWEVILKNHVRNGTFKNTTHMVFVFAPHTFPRDKQHLINEMRKMLRTAGIGCEVLVFDTLLHDNHLMEIMTPIMDSYKTFPDLPDTHLQVSNIMAFHKYMLPEVLGNHLKDQNPRVLHQLLEKVKSMARNDPQALNDDPVWAKIHKALIVAFADQPFMYKEWMSKYKSSLPKGTPERTALEKLYKDSFKDDAKIHKLLSDIDHRKIIGFLVVDDGADIDEDKIINAIRAKITLLSVIKKMRNHMTYQRRNGLEIDPANLPGMPILDPRRASSKECRAMFQLLFIQWTQASLNEMLQWISAMYLLTSSGRAVDPEIVTMVEKSFFDAEKHTIKMMGLSDDGINVDKRELLFHVPITKMLAEVLTLHKKKMFPITLGGQEGDIPISRRVLMDQINTWKKVSQIHSFIRTIHDAIRPTITRTVTKIIKQGTGSNASNLAPGDVVEFCNEKHGVSRYRKNKKKRQEPWINLPTIGVVVECRYNCHTQLFEVLIQQLDDVEWDGLFYESNNYHTDAQRYNVTNIEQLNLMVLASIPVDDDEIQMTGAVEPHREMVFEINRYLMGLKAQGGVYHRDAVVVGGLREENLNHIKGICGSAKSVTHDIDVQVDLPLEVIYRGLPVQKNMWSLIKSGSNPNMTEILRLIDNLIHTEHDRITSFDYKHSGLKYHAVLTKGEFQKIKDYYDRKFREFNTFGSGLEALNEVECSICYDTAFFRLMNRHPCGHFQCHDCTEHMVKYYKPGDVVQNMNCLCPECRTPIDHPDGRIKELFKQHPTGLPNGKLFRFCTDRRCGCALFEQDMPCGQVIELSEVKCEACRPPALCSHPCPSCGILTNKESGCDHITCRCGAHWCYRCGQKFENGQATYDHMLSGQCPGGRGFGF